MVADEQIEVSLLFSTSSEYLSFVGSACGQAVCHSDFKYSELNSNTGVDAPASGTATSQAFGLSNTSAQSYSY